MRLWKGLITAALAAGLLGAMTPVATMAATKTISSVTIYVGLDDLEPGETLPDESVFEGSTTGDYVYTESDRYTLNDLEWITSDSREMTIGYEPKMRVELHATDSEEYAFKGGYSSSNVRIKGGTFVSASRSGSDTLYVTFKFRPIKGEYLSPDNAWWKDGNQYGQARWSAPENGSDAYDVYLYRGSSLVKKVEELRATSYNFYPYMTREGTYSFKVRTVPYTDEQKKYGDKSDWMESDEVYLPEEDVSDGSGQETGGSGGGPVGTGPVGWIQENGSWYYRYPDGTYQNNSWAKINDKWYLFDSNSVMLTGWQQRNNLWYYLNSDGAMITGWVLSNNKWYYMNPSTTSGVEGAMVTGWISHNNKWYCTDTSGVMLEGWQQVNGNWYYFYPGEGSMAVNTVISGFPVDENGIWHE